MENLKVLLEWAWRQFELKISLNSVLVVLTFLAVVVPAVSKLVKYLVGKSRTKSLSSDLEPFFYPSEVKKAVDIFIRTRFQNVNPGNYSDLSDNHAFTVSEDLIKHFLNVSFRAGGDNHRYYIILADAGMGKTTFMINLYRKYKRRFNMFGLRDKYDIKLFPLRDDSVMDTIQNIDNEAKHTILLLDAFDEFDNDNKYGDDKMGYLLSKVSRFKEVVITSRTNYFKKSEEEPNKTGLFKNGPNPDEWRFGKFYISPFSDADVLAYVRKCFAFYQVKKRRKARRLLLNYHDLKFRPMLISNLGDLIDTPEVLQYNYLVYEFLIEKWINREVLKVRDHPDYKAELYRFSFALTKYFIKNRTLSINFNEILLLSREFNIQLRELDITSRSLLNRNSENMYKFSHKTIFEYFAACLLFANEVSATELPLETNDLIAKFHWEMCANKILTPLLTSLNLKHGQQYNFSTKVRIENQFGCKCFTPVGAERQSVLWIFDYFKLVASETISPALLEAYPKLKYVFKFDTAGAAEN